MAIEETLYETKYEQAHPFAETDDRPHWAAEGATAAEAAAEKPPLMQCVCVSVSKIPNKTEFKTVYETKC